jgi:alpha-tubulin suppressor-like RCC1 family protein
MRQHAISALAIFAMVLTFSGVSAHAQGLTITPSNPTIPVGQTQQFAVSGIAAATAVNAGSFHTCAILQDGAIWCWGLNDWGQLGDGTRTSSATARPVSGLIGAAAVDGGGYHTCARFAGGNVECWGRNDQGQLGNTATTADSSTAPLSVTGVSTATAVTAGGFHTCAPLTNGTVQCWGQNDFGQLGNGLISPIGTAPGPVTGLSGVVAVSAGGWHTCALLNNGRVRCWGQNTYGALGDGTIISSPLPVAVSGITNAVALEAGIFHTCARLADGAVQCWGRNDDGQLGNGTRTNSSVPTTVAGIAPAALAPGAEHSCVVFPDGTIRCWGDNNFGQLGNDSPDGMTATTPSNPVAGINTTVAATSGAVHTCALLQGGAVRCWGMGADGRLGDGTTTDRFTPVNVLGLEGATWASSDSTVATINATGLATAVGPGTTTITATSGTQTGTTSLNVTPRNTLSVVREGVGNGTVASNPAGIDCGSTCSATYDQGATVTLSATPAAGSTFEGWGGACTGIGQCTVTMSANAMVTASFGSSPVQTFTLAATRDGTGAGEVHFNPGGYVCGTTCTAAYQDGTVVTLTVVPGNMSVFAGWSGGGCSGTGSCTITLRANTTVNATFHGINRRETAPSNIGNASLVGRATPPSSVRGARLQNRTAMHRLNLRRMTAWKRGCVMKKMMPRFVASAFIGFLLTMAGTEVWAQAITVTPANPTASIGRTQQFAADGAVVATAVWAGAFHACALVQDGSVRCWGLNDSGQLGNGTRLNANSPVPVAGLAGASAVAAGGFHSCAVFPNGTLSCWGRNDSRQLGDPATTAESSTVPVPVGGIVNATAVAVGAFHTCALLANGTVRCWGLNDNGQLGDGTVINSGGPVTVSGLGGVVAIAAGGWHTCALLADGTARCWGENLYGQLGNGTFVNALTPTPVSGLTNLARIPAGIFHHCAIAQNGTLSCWGRNDEGRLGIGNTANTPTPTTVNGITVTAAAGGGEHGCGVLTDGTIRCWGWNDYGQLGNGGGTTTVPTAPVNGITNAASVGTGAEFSCALVSGGVVRCWGRNIYGQLGDATNTDARAPVAVAGLGLTWTSSNTNVAVINAAGLATGVAAGSTTITATAGDQSGSTALTVTAPVTLTLIREGVGTGRVASNPAGIDCGPTCSASYDRNTTVTLTATPSSDSVFEAWTGAGCAGTGSCTVTMTAATTVTARFGLAQFRLSVTRAGAGTGTVTSNPAGINCGTACSATYDPNTTVTLTAAAAPGSAFAGWTGGGCTGTGTCTVTLGANTNVVATFVPRFTLTVNVNGNGTVTSTPAGISCSRTCSAAYNQGTAITLRATPGALYVFVGWSGGGCSGTGTCTVNMNANTTVTATFRLLGLL